MSWWLDINLFRLDTRGLSVKFFLWKLTRICWNYWGSLSGFVRKCPHANPFAWRGKLESFLCKLSKLFSNEHHAIFSREFNAYTYIYIFNIIINMNRFTLHNFPLDFQLFFIELSFFNHHGFPFPLRYFVSGLSLFFTHIPRTINNLILVFAIKKHLI